MVTEAGQKTVDIEMARAVSVSGGNGYNLHGRLSAVEAQLQHFATKEEIRGIEGSIARRESLMLRWLIGIMAVATVSLGAVLLRTVLS